MYDPNPNIPSYYRKAVAITPHDSNEISPRPKAVRCITTGNLACRLRDSAADSTFTGVAANVILPISVKLVKSTGTTGTWEALY